MKIGLTQQKRSVMLSALKAGAFYRDAASAAGIPWSTWTQWNRSVQSGDCNDSDVVAFVEEARRIYSSATVVLHSTVMKSGASDWKAAAWLLEHRRGDPMARHDDRRARWEAEIAAKRAKGEHVDRMAVDDSAVAELREKLKRALGE